MARLPRLGNLLSRRNKMKNYSLCPDDHHTGPTANSGPRITCGVIEAD